MANKNVKNVEETNVVKASEVKGTPNNVGQEIAPVKASEEVISCTMTEEEHVARKNRIYEKMEQGLRLSWDIIVDITSARSRNEQELDGYSKSSEDFLKWANDMFEMGATQVKQAIRIVEFYGSIDDKGEYTLEDKYKRYTKEKLDIIQRLPQVKTKADFDSATEALGIMPSTSEGVLKDLVKQAKGIESKDEKSKDEKPKEKKVSEKDIKESEVYKKVENELNGTKDLAVNLTKLVRDFLHYAKDNKMNDKAFREAYIKEVEASGLIIDTDK